MRPENLFPICQDPACPDRGKHQHLMPHQKELISAEEKYVYLQGGYGAAKTMPACAFGVLLSLMVPGNRGIVIRESYPKLHDSTQRVFMETLERGKIKFKGRENRDGWYHRIILSNKSEVVFREAKNLGRFLGPEYGWFLVDEAFEIDKEVFKKLQGRLRLPAARGYHRGMLLSNPPPHHSWLHEVFGDTPGRFEREVEIDGKIEVVTFRFMKVSTRANPHNPPGYLADILTGLTQDEIARLVDGEYGYTLEGPPVYPMFEHHRHVGLPVVRKIQTLVRAWDFGFRHPACTWHQFWRCRKTNIHWAILDAVDGRMIEALPFADEVLTHTRAAFVGIDSLLIEDCGDRAGAKQSDTGPGPIVQLNQPPHNLSIHYKVCDVEPGIRMIRDFLRLLPCECGESRFLVHRKNRYVIEGFQGGYHLKKKPSATVKEEEPYKDGFYDDFMDSVRYSAEHYLRPELLDATLMEKLEATDPRRRHPRGDPWQSAMREILSRRN